MQGRSVLKIQEKNMLVLTMPGHRFGGLQLSRDSVLEVKGCKGRMLELQWCLRDKEVRGTHPMLQGGREGEIVRDGGLAAGRGREAKRQ